MVPNKIKITRILRKILTVPIYKYINQKIVQKSLKMIKGGKKHNKQAKKRNVQTSERQY